MDDTIEHSDFRAFRYSNFNIYDLDTSFDFPDKYQGDMFGHINIFVGENNTGKSRLMREMAKMQTHHIYLCDLIDENGNSLREHVENTKNRIEQALEISGKVENLSIIGEDISYHANKLSEVDELLDIESDTFEIYRDFFENIDIDDPTSLLVDSGQRNTRLTGGVTLNSIIQGYMQELRNLLCKLPKKNELGFCNIFIGTLRSLRVIDLDYHSGLRARQFIEPKVESGNPRIDVYDVFENIYRAEYGFPKAPKTLVFTGMTIYRELIDYLLGLQEKRIVIQKYQEFLSKHFFDGKPIVLMPAIDKGYVRIKIGDEQERVISELGDGLQTVIILTFLPFVKNEQHERAYVYMDEPEMFLHPGMQRKLLTALANLKFCTFFMTTHSNHLLDITIDQPGVTIFNFQKSTTETYQGNPKVIVKKVDSDRSSCLELLGVRNSSVFLANSTLWVEGITDRWYLKAMLESYIEQKALYAYKEDIHYAFVEYGGGTLTHWSFLDDGGDPDEDPREQIEVQYLCSKAMVIADSDNATGEKLRRQQRLQELLKERFLLQAGKEIENALDPEVIRKTIAEFEKIPLTDIPAMNHTDYKGKGIGGYITNLNWNGKTIKKYADQSGTLNNNWKTKFCREACKHIAYNTLPPDTQTMIERIYTFITTQNPH